MSNTDHSPLPWRAVYETNIVDANGSHVFTRDGNLPGRDYRQEKIDNVQRTLRAVNSHADLLAACEEAYRLAVIAVVNGLGGFSEEEAKAIVKNHVSLKPIVEAIAKAGSNLDCDDLIDEAWRLRLSVDELDDDDPYAVYSEWTEEE